MVKAQTHTPPHTTLLPPVPTAHFFSSAVLAVRKKLRDGVITSKLCSREPPASTISLQGVGQGAGL